MIKANYHTHTYRCKHASGDVNDYVKAALEAGIDTLGMSDHSALPDNRWIEMRMNMSELEDYSNSIDKANESFPHIKILKGMECEYIKEYHSFYSEELLGKYSFDYLSASAHFYPYKGDWPSGWAINSKDKLAAYAEYVVQMMETGLFDYVAHPDMFGGPYEIWDENAATCSKYIFEASKALNVPLEINAYGFRKGLIRASRQTRYAYPWEPFWELASEYGVTVTVNSDAHTPQDIMRRMEDALELANKYKLKVVDNPLFCNRRNLK